MTEQNANEQVIGVVVVAQNPTQLAAVIAADLFKDIDFSGLNGAIDAMAKSNKNLDKETKEAALSIIQEWNGEVLDRLEERRRDMDVFMNNFSIHANYHDDEFMDNAEELATRTGTLAQYQEWRKAAEELEDHQQTRPEKPVQELGMTYEAYLDSTKDYELAEQKYSIKERQLSRTVIQKLKDWKKLLNEDANVKELLKKARAYTRNVSKFKKQCEEKTRLAKLNVSVASDDLRKSLSELLDFTLTI